MAATVGYLFGYDATARMVADRMHERVIGAHFADGSGGHGRGPGWMR